MANPMSFPLMDNDPIQIYQDPFASAPMISHTPMPSSAPKPQQQHQQQHQQLHQQLHQQIHQQQQRPRSLQPHKGNPLMGAPLSSPQQYAQISPDHPIPMTQTNPMIKKSPYMAQFKSVMPTPYGKENGTHPHIYPAPTMPMPIPPFYATMAPTKPALLEAAPIKEYRQPKDRHHRPAKKIKLDDATTLRPHDSFPPLPDDGQKPSHSYAQLIGMAILRSPNRRLTLSQIYKWISDHFSFYKPGDSGWQNSIRHNLSLHKAFVKMERPKDDPGKGNYWLIDAEQEHVFTKEKSSKKTSSAGENVSVMSARPEPSPKPATSAVAASAAAGPSSSAAAAAPTSPAVAKTEPPSQQDLLPPPLAVGGNPQSGSAKAAEPSSEATIAVSDAAEEPQQDDATHDHDGQDTTLLSPMAPPSIHSSPPVPRHATVLDGATPPSLHAPAGRKRKRASIDDSGYMSAFESSVMRPNKKNVLLTSEADRPRTKRAGNRAEDEILRIPRMRASSHESPSKGRSRNGAMPPPPPSSSPICSRSQLMLPPGTPAGKLRARTGCPPSVSPTTNLRNHRHQVSRMLESPFKRVPSMVEDAHPASPIFNLDYLHPGPSFGGVDSPASGFNIYHDLSEDIFSMHAAANGSPVKKSTTMRRGRIERTQSASALADITSAASNKGMQGAAQVDITHASIMFSPNKTLRFESSPTKAFIQSSPVSESPTKDMAGQQWGQSDRVEDFFAPPPAMSQTYEMLGAQPFDMLQGFQKIGSVPASQAGAPRPVPKPVLGRSYSNII